MNAARATSTQLKEPRACPPQAMNATRAGPPLLKQPRACPPQARACPPQPETSKVGTSSLEPSFKRFDLNNDGQIDDAELAAALRSAGVSMSVLRKPEREADNISFGPNPIAYVPAEFWRVAFATEGSTIPKIFMRSLYITVLAAVPAAVLAYYDLVTVQVPTAYVTPFGILVGLLTSFRLNNAYGKWEKGSMCVVSLHNMACQIVTRICAQFPADVAATPFAPSPAEAPSSSSSAAAPSAAESSALERRRELHARLERIRRLVVLTCVSMKKHIRRVKTFDEEARSGLISGDEARMLQHVATVTPSDGKWDLYPSRNLPM